MCTTPSPTTSQRQFSATSVTRVLKSLHASSRLVAHRNWLQAVAAKVVAQRPDLSEPLLDLLGVEPLSENLLEDLSIGEISVCYEALLAGLDPDARKESGQFFTPDDAARFMAERSKKFGDGVWLDPCCGVGNLSWHLASVQDDPGEFVSHGLVLIDQDETALKSAVALIGADFLDTCDVAGLRAFYERAVQRDFLSSQRLPSHDFVIVNPPYARTAQRNGFETSSTRESFAYFIERVAKNSRGFISVTPASYISAPKFQVLREVIQREFLGGDVFAFDNVPDTLFRGYKFGSANTSKTNFVRASITVCSPNHTSWRITPIIRWKSASRAAMFANCASLLSELKIGPHGEWAKIPPRMGGTWEWLTGVPETLADLVVKEPTQHSLTVALTPRYYISAAFRPLQRGSKAVLHFRTEQDRDRAALVLNSSIPYLWWRALDGGVTLPRRVLESTPMPVLEGIDDELLDELVADEESSLVTKLNAGRINENIKRPHELVARLNDVVLPDGKADLDLIYSEDMFAALPASPSAPKTPSSAD